MLDSFDLTFFGVSQGIGAGGGTSGQVLVFHDMLGMLSHPQHEQFVPKFCKKYAQVGHAIQGGLKGKFDLGEAVACLRNKS